MTILIVSATPFEIAPLEAYLTTHFEKTSVATYKKGNVEANILVSGVGMASTAFALGSTLAARKFDLAIHAGVAGAFNRSLKIGDVVNIVSEQYGDLGVEEADGRFTDVFDLGLIAPNQAPFINGKLYNPLAGEFEFLPKQAGLTVNKVSGTLASIEAITQKYQADVETMEGAAFFQACLLSEVNFLQIRAISNYVEPRNREGWDLPLAIGNLNKVLVEMLETFG